MVERFMRTLKDMVSKYIDSQGLHWDEGTRSFAMAYNSSVHETTGYTPFYLIHGFEPRLPLDVVYGGEDAAAPAQTFLNERLKNMKRAFASVRRSSSDAAARMAVRHDSRVNFTPYTTGSKVWVRDHTASVGGKPKLGLPFKGPVTIIEKLGTPGKEVIYRVQDNQGKTRIVHHNDLKEFIHRRTDSQSAPRPSGSLTQNKFTPAEGTLCEPEYSQDVQLEIPLMNLLGGVGSPVGTDLQREVPGTPAAPYVTRSGRVSRPPERFQAGK